MPRGQKIRSFSSDRGRGGWWKETAGEKEKARIIGMARRRLASRMGVGGTREGKAAPLSCLLQGEEGMGMGGKGSDVASRESTTMATHDTKKRQIFIFLQFI